jgi:hypothetical protein
MTIIRLEELMAVQRGGGLQFTLVKTILDPTAQRRNVEEKIRAVEEWNNLLLENAARMAMRPYTQSKAQTVLKEMVNSGSQLSLPFENHAVSARVCPAATD